MAVCDGDAMTAERRRQRSSTRRRNGLIQTEVFDRDARPLQLTREPPFTIRRQKDDALTTGRLKSFRQVDDDALGATRTVGLDQLCNPQHWEFRRVERSPRLLFAVPRQARPACRAFPSRRATGRTIRRRIPAARRSAPATARRLAAARKTR